MNQSFWGVGLIQLARCLRAVMVFSLCQQYPFMYFSFNVSLGNLEIIFKALCFYGLMQEIDSFENIRPLTKVTMRQREPLM